MRILILILLIGGCSMAQVKTISNYTSQSSHTHTTLAGGYFIQDGKRIDIIRLLDDFSYPDYVKVSYMQPVTKDGSEWANASSWILRKDLKYNIGTTK